MNAVLSAAAVLLLFAAPLAAQQRVFVGDPGPGPTARIIQEALARPHRLVEPDTAWFILRRNAQETSLIVLGRTAAIGGLVDGDVLVIGGDLHVRPGGRITGRAVAIGGGVYPSSLAYIAKGSASFRDNTFTITRTTDGYRLDYLSLREHASGPSVFPGFYGLQLPSYDRVNGISMPFGPSFSFAGGRGEVEALATYRSDIGKIDPAATVRLEIAPRLRATGTLQRGTLSNDAWIWSNFVNSLSVLVLGVDTRNYYRADRADVSLFRLWESSHIQVEPFVGALTEKAWSVGPAFGDRHGPWSIFGRTDSLGMLRPNPPVSPGRITSALAGLGAQFESQSVRINARSSGEISVESPLDERFQQMVSDVELSFPTFGVQEYAMDVHWVTTFGDTPPPQRFAYIGGAGTLPFIDLLSQGGDELLLIDQRYMVPLPKMQLGLFGAPTLLLRHRLGSAGVSRLPSLEQIIGFGAVLTLIRGEIQIDPARRKVRAGVGFSFAR